jgi:hypothetical protein
MSRLAAMLLVCAFLCIPGTEAPAQTQQGPIADFMIMDVCVDAHDKVKPDVTPLDAACTHRRKIRAGEPIPYELHNFPAANGPCKLRLGTLSKVAVPVEKNGVTRFVVYYDKGVDHSCPGVSPDDPAFGRLDRNESGSVLWYDDEYSFWLGSWSLVANSNFKSPLCQPDRHSSRQFFRGRILAPVVVPAKAGVVGYGVFQSNNMAGAPGQSVDQCPANYHQHITTWVRDSFAFTSGARLEVVISSHYTGVDEAGTGLGRAKQLERTYWTREFGFTRWEKWSRDDWVNERNGKASPELGSVLFAKAQCGKPYEMPASVSPTLGYDPMSEGGSYSQIVHDPQTGEQHRWYLTICDDYTNIVKGHAGDAKPAWESQISDVYWLP